MNERDLETRLRDAYRVEAGRADPGALTERVHSIPATVEPERRRPWHRFRSGAARRAGLGGAQVRGASNMLSAARIAAVVAALALGTTFLAVQVGSPPEAAAPAAAPAEDWVTVTGLQDFQSQGYGRAVATNTMSDPRFDGEVQITWDSESRYASDSSDYTLWGTVTITNDGGAWQGQWIGFVDEQQLHHITTWFEGTDGYEGLKYLAQLAQQEPDGPLHSTGLVYSGTIPPTVVPAVVGE